MKIKNVILVILLIISFNLSADTVLNHASVNQLIMNVQESTKKQDVNKLASYLAEDATITIVNLSNAGDTMNLTKTDYINMLKLNWALSAKFSYEVKNINIIISENEKSATVSDFTIETVEMDGKIIASSQSQENIKIIISGGVPKIQSIHSNVKM